MAMINLISVGVMCCRYKNSLNLELAAGEFAAVIVCCRDKSIVGHDDAHTLEEE